MVDRPSHVDFFQSLAEKYQVQLGLMANALARKSLMEKFKTLDSANLVKFMDSGVFGSQAVRTNKLLDYPELFDLYDSLGADFGVMLDVLHDRYATARSGQRAHRFYNEKEYSFKLVGVAQGTNLNEYLWSYQNLKEWGFEHIALGGLLKRRNSHNANVQDERFVQNLILEIRKRYPRDWLFALGIYAPKRHEFLDKHNVFGSDGRGWMFRYKQQNHLGKLGARASKFAQREAWIHEHIIRQMKSIPDYDILTRAFDDQATTQA